ncbi:MAG: DUF4430 domain-containing protein [Solirubrobacterales bacterium]
MRKLIAPAIGAITTLALIAAPTEAANTVIADLRVLTPDTTLEEGTSYVVGREKVPTDPNAECSFGGAGGSGERYTLPQPTALGLLKAASEANHTLRPLSLTDEFGFGLAICGIGGVDGSNGSFWSVRKNGKEANQGAQILEVREGNEIVFYLTPDVFPDPNPGALTLHVQPRAMPGTVEARVTLTQCVSNPEPPFENVCSKDPAGGVEITGGSTEVVTGSDGIAQVPVVAQGSYSLQAVDPPFIPSRALSVCVSSELDECPPFRGKKIIGRVQSDKIDGTRGPDRIRGGGGADEIRITQGGEDVVACGAGSDTVIRREEDADDDLRDCEHVVRR